MVDKATPPSRGSYPVSEAHLRAIGGIVVCWSHIEMAMEVAICGLYEISPDRGLVLTSNIGFQSRIILLRVLATRGATADKGIASALTALLARIEAASADRNAAAHGTWSGTADPDTARRMAIRVRGNRLRCVDDRIEIAQLEATLARIDRLRLDFATQLVRLKLRWPTSS